MSCIGQDGAEDLTQIIISAKRHKEVAEQAAAEAISSATKTKEILTDALVSIESEVANVRLESIQLQVGELETPALKICRFLVVQFRLMQFWKKGS